jgi:transglutaminase-like putative cysteine protease
MNSAHSKNNLTFLLCSIGLIVLPHFKNLPPPIFAFFYLLLGWRFIGIRKQSWLPGKPGIFLLSVCGLALLYSQYQGMLGRDPGTHLFITALALKLFEIKSARDLYLVTYLAFIVAASQFLYEQSLLMAAYILLVCCMLLATLISINSHQPQTGAALKTALTIIVQALPIAVVLFILFPRVEAPRWLLFNEPHQAKSGLSDHMEPGSITSLGMSDELVFRVKFTGVLPPPAQRYWRGPVLSRTDGKRWTQAANKEFRQADKTVFKGLAYQYTLLMEPQDKKWVFALDMPAEYSSSLSRNANYQLTTSAYPDKRIEYKITSYTQYNTGYITQAEYEDATQLPGQPSAKIKRLVSQLRGFDGTPDIFIKNLLNHFRTENFHYTLTPPLMEEDPIESFLFKTRYGFCSHYAAAFVYLMRTAHIPARVVTGYQGGELNKIGGFLEIRQADAHAWSEVWLQNRGWTRLDPTAAVAPERIERNINMERLMAGNAFSLAPASTTAQEVFNWLKQARQLWGNVDYNWQRWVINYDNRNQARFLSSLGIPDIKTMIYWMIIITALLTAVLSWFLLHQKQKTTGQALRIYNRFCKKVAKRGLLRGSGEGAKNFAERVKIKFPERAGDIDQITDVFIKLHYGKNATPDDLKKLGKRVALFKIT